MASKVCSRCNVIKSVSDFNHDSYSSDGYKYKCKSCSVQLYKEWRNNNREHYNEHNRNYYATTPQRRISKSMHNKLMNTLRRGIYSARTEQIIGLNMTTFLEWLSYNFEGEMCFANYGKVWQFDLVVPASSYDLTDERQLLTAFNWRNIRPCIKKDNLAKYNFICQITIANQSIRVLGFIRKMRQIRIEHFKKNIE